MQIDFHYGVIYVVSRLAGMDAASARTIAHSCQYVDDAANCDIWDVARGRLASLGGVPLQAARWQELNLQTPLSWTAFHFVPGGEGRRTEEKAVCRPNSPAAIAAVQRAIDARGARNGLHRLGVALHSYIDTWAHQQFSGIVSRHNLVFYLEGDERSFDRSAAGFQRAFHTAGMTIAALSLDLVSRLGHGAALHYPDMPWMKWGYRNGHNQRIDRDNLVQFMIAADMACRAVRGYRKGNLRFFDERGLCAEEKTALEQLLLHNRDRNRHRRLSTILDEVAEGAIPGVREPVPGYVASGAGSWDQAAKDILFAPAQASRAQRLENFEQSDYCNVRTAIAQHRRDLVNEILPANRIVLG